VKTIRTECLDQFVIFGERHLRHLVRELLIHYMTELPPRDRKSDHPPDCVAEQRHRTGRCDQMPVPSRRSAQLLLP
jgi:hypothetical protein